MSGSFVQHIAEHFGGCGTVALAAAEQFFHGNAGFAAHEVSRPAHQHGQTKTSENVAQSDRGVRGHLMKIAPAERLPKRG